MIIGQSTCIDTSSGSTDSVQISCQLENEMAASPYTISWSRNGQDLGFNGNIYTATDNGTYTCKAENECGSDTQSSVINSKLLFMYFNFILVTHFNFQVSHNGKQVHGVK